MSCGQPGLHASADLAGRALRAAGRRDCGRALGRLPYGAFALDAAGLRRSSETVPFDHAKQRGSLRSVGRVAATSMAWVVEFTTVL